MQENSFYIPCCSHNWKSKQPCKIHLIFQNIVQILDESRSYIINFYIYYTFFHIWYCARAQLISQHVDTRQLNVPI